MKLLLCEDERALSSATVAILKNSKYDVDAAYDGVEALELISQNTYDTIILDIMMPKKDGVTVLKELRQSGNNIPVILLTAKANIEDKISGLDLGANDYLTKPYEIEELLARIRVLTRDLNHYVFNVGNTQLNKENYELKTEFGSYRLSNQEFIMLEIFMSNVSNQISSSYLLEKIWNNDEELGVVEIYISFLQKKMESINCNIGIKKRNSDTFLLEVL